MASRRVALLVAATVLIALGAKEAPAETAVDHTKLLASALAATDRAADAGIAQLTRSYGTYVGDYDLDGDQDFLYNRHAGSEMILYANDGSGHFAQRFTGLFPINDRHDCAWGDVNRDGLPDTYCAVGASRGRDVKANELWLQRPDHSFSRAASAWGAVDPYGRGREPALFDVNGDGRLDLFVGNFYPRVDDFPTKNRLYIQDPPGAFRSAPEYGVDLEIGGQCAEPADFDRDGDLDLMVCAHGTNVALKLYRNDDGVSFTNVAAVHGLTGQWCDALWVDLNLDGRVDITTMNRKTFKVLLQRSDGTFAVVYQRSMGRAGCRFGGGGNRVAAGDVNGDSFPDLYVLYSGYTSGAYNLPDVFLVNDGTGTGFSTASLPQTSKGSGFSVYPIEADADPPTEFLVTNGRGSFKGPIQLIDFGA
jgi:FG-GAP-like repeat